MGADLSLEVQQGSSVSLNEKRKTKTFKFPISQIISTDPVAKVAEDITASYH